jgi:6-phosphogluconolactonase
MRHDLQVFADPAAVAKAGAALIAARARSARDDFHLALSGGRTPWDMLRHLADEDLPWERITIYQVDERVAPDGDDARNWTHIAASLASVNVRAIPMPVNDPDLERACTSYGETLPAHFDLVHLGLGPDGHTASLVPGDPVLEVRDRLVALTAAYQDHRRMTLTYPALARAREVLWLVTGAEKQRPLAQLLGDDPAIPASGVTADSSTVFADRDAASKE